MEYNTYRCDEAIDIMQKRVIPAAKQQKGFKGFWMLVDRSSGKSFTISLWEEESDASVTGESSQYFRDALAHLVPLLSGEPGVEDYEIVIQE
jgi:heme-degrading monooxygenase HmoA